MTEIKWKYGIGDRIIDYDEDGTLFKDFTVVDRKIVEEKYKYKYYKFICNLCNSESKWIREDGLSNRKQGCLNCRRYSWKYSVGDRIVKKSENGTTIVDFVITNRVVRTKKVKSKSKRGYNNYNLRYYEYRCNICGAEHLWKAEREVERNGCACCHGAIKIKGINTVGDLHPHVLQYIDEKVAFNPEIGHDSKCNAKCPECGFQKEVRIGNLIQDGFHCNYCNSFGNKKPHLIKFLANKNDTSLSYATSKQVMTKCPDCGYEKQMHLSDLSFYGYHCPKCGDGISFAEKFMFNMLSQLNIKFIYQLSATQLSWCEKYRYDFYIPSTETIIETHGIQHYENTFVRLTGLTVKEQQENDNNKECLAKTNNIKNYIVLDCRQSDCDWIKNSILSSKLNEIYDLSQINWNQCLEAALNNLVKNICDYWNAHHDITTEYVAQKFQLNRKTVSRYLKIGTHLGWCHYYPQKESRKGKRVLIFKDEKLLGIFNSIRDLANSSQLFYGTKLLASEISRVCHGKKPHYKGYVFKFAD